MKKNIFLILLSLLCIPILYSCGGKETPPTPEDETFVTRNFVVQNQLNTNAKCFINLYEGLTYNKTDAASNQAKIDLVLWQYTGTSLNNDSYLRSPLEIHNDATGAGEALEMELGINSWTVRKDATSSNSDLSIAGFDAIDTKTKLLAAFNQDSHTRVNYSALSYTSGELIANVFTVQDKNGKRGFMKINQLTSGTTGSMSVSLKIEK